jgi:phage terminase small subunit
MSGHSPEETSIREDLFIAGVVAGKTLTQSAIDAGYAEKNADVQAQQLMKRPHVARAIKAASASVAKAHRVSAERTVEELAVIGFSDISHYTVDGKPITDWLGLTADAPKSALRAIKKVKRKPVA